MFESLEITILCDNETLNPKLATDYGFSALVELGDRSLLFDCGPSGIFIDNAKKLKKNLGKVEAAVFSHNHYDHTRGFLSFAQKFDASVPVYVSENFFKTCGWKKEQDGDYILITSGPLSASKLSELGCQTRAVYKDIHPLEDFEGIYVMSNIKRTVGFEKRDELDIICQNNTWETDPYNDELILVAESSRGLVILTGCAHVGSANIIEAVKAAFNQPIYAFIGGTHLIAYDEKRAQLTADYFVKSGVPVIAPCHCTGEQAQKFLNAVGIQTIGCGYNLKIL